MSVSTILAVAPFLKDTFTELAGGMADCHREIGKGTGHAIASIGDAVADRIRGPR